MTPSQIVTYDVFVGVNDISRCPEHRLYLPSDPNSSPPGDENRVKTQKPQDKIPGTPKIGGRNPKTPKVGRVETLFYMAIDVSIDIKRSGGQKGHVLYSRRGLVTIDIDGPTLESIV